MQWCYTKPDEVFLLLAKQLGITPENAIVFEDSVAGVQAANIPKWWVLVLVTKKLARG
jgi:HAD superfamily hydrolase (TIGR01509 family)